MGKITGPWRCFYCGEICATEAHAREHFGGVRGALAACQLKSSDRHLIEVIRDQEEQLASYRAEDSEVLRAMYAQGAEHSTALRQAEERGYAKGVADMKAQGLCADPTAHQINATAARAYG